MGHQSKSCGDKSVCKRKTPHWADHRQSKLQKRTVRLAVVAEYLISSRVCLFRPIYLSWINFHIALLRTGRNSSTDLCPVPYDMFGWSARWHEGYSTFHLSFQFFADGGVVDPLVPCVLWRGFGDWVGGECWRCLSTLLSSMLTNISMVTVRSMSSLGTPSQAFCDRKVDFGWIESVKPSWGEMAWNFIVGWLRRTERAE